MYTVEWICRRRWPLSMGEVCRTFLVSMWERFVRRTVVSRITSILLSYIWKQDICTYSEHWAGHFYESNMEESWTIVWEWEGQVSKNGEYGRAACSYMSKTVEWEAWMRAGVKTWEGYLWEGHSYRGEYLGGTLQGKSHLWIPFLGIVRPQSQFPHSCAFERFIYSQDRYT